jgi:SAM-dependent methyltransferase
MRDEVLRLYIGTPRSIRAFLWLRSILTPYDAIAAMLPTDGRVLDLGAGYGLLSVALSLGAPQREVIGIDHDVTRVSIAQAAALRLSPSRPRFEVGDLKAKLAEFSAGSLAGIAMIDVLHYFDSASQLFLISNAARSLRPGGTLVLREIDADAGGKAVVNRFYERLATGVGFTRSANRSLAFRGAREWTSLLESAGFTVRSKPSGPPFLADVLFAASRKL